MFKYLKWFLILWVLFVAVSVAGGGGDQFRSFNEKAGGFSQRLFELVAAKADSLKEDAEGLADIIKRATGKKSELAGNAF